WKFHRSLSRAILRQDSCQVPVNPAFVITTTKPCGFLDAPVVQGRRPCRRKARGPGRHLLFSPLRVGAGGSPAGRDALVSGGGRFLLRVCILGREATHYDRSPAEARSSGPRETPRPRRRLRQHSTR